MTGFNMMSNTESKWRTLESLTNNTHKLLVEHIQSGREFQAQVDSLTTAADDARSAKRAIDGADMDLESAETEARHARNMVMSACGLLLASDGDARLVKPADLGRFSDGECLAILDEYAARPTQTNAVAAAFIGVVPTLRSQFLARQVAATEARSAAKRARHAWASAVLRLESAIAGIRAEMIAVGIRLPSRRKSKHKGDEAKLTVVSPSTASANTVNAG